MKNETRTVGQISLGGLASFDLDVRRHEGCSSKCWIGPSEGQVSLNIGAPAQLLQALRATTDAEYSKLWRLMSATAHHIAAAYLKMSIEPQYCDVTGYINPAPPEGHSTPAFVQARTFDGEPLHATALLLETVAVRIAGQEADASWARVEATGAHRPLSATRKTTIGQIRLSDVASLDLDMHQNVGCSSNECGASGGGSVYLSIGDSDQLLALLRSTTKTEYFNLLRSMKALAHEVVARYLQMSTTPEYTGVAGEVSVTEPDSSTPAEVGAHASDGESIEATARLLEGVALRIAAEWGSAAVTEAEPRTAP
jgi:hypothetical protein